MQRFTGESGFQACSEVDKHLFPLLDPPLKTRVGFIRLTKTLARRSGGNSAASNHGEDYLPEEDECSTSQPDSADPRESLQGSQEKGSQKEDTCRATKAEEEGVSGAESGNAESASRGISGKRRDEAPSSSQGRRPSLRWRHEGSPSWTVPQETRFQG